MSGAGAGRLVTFTVVRYSAARALLGALHMATQRPLLSSTPGLAFFRLMGMGAGIGFSAIPDLRSWALLCAWNRVGDWDGFADESSVMRQYRRRGEELFTMLLEPVSSHGSWGGAQPFGGSESASLSPTEPTVVLTRATIRLSRAVRFWSQVGRVDATLRGNPNLLLSFGAGEAPYFLQSTVSVWRSGDAMRRWAYSTDRHREVVRRTREEGWYREELFARFRLLGREGTLLGRDPLAALG